MVMILLPKWTQFATGATSSIVKTDRQTEGSKRHKRLCISMLSMNTKLFI